MDKTKRVANFTKTEEEMLVALVFKYKSIVECKKTDTTSSRDKEQAWNTLCAEFNASGSTYRDAPTLRRKYENIKKRTKKKYADEKCHVRGTGGGGPLTIEIDSVDKTIKNLLGTQVTGSASQYDGDTEIVIVQGVESPNTTETQDHDWGKYTPSMLQSPRSLELMPIGLQAKIVEHNKSDSNDINEQSSISIDNNGKQSVSSKIQINDDQTKSKINIPCRTPKKKSADMKWTQVGQAKLELLTLQKQYVTEEHNFKMDMLKQENKIKLEILQCELEIKKKQLEKNE